jgi:hypothetical protein
MFVDDRYDYIEKDIDYYNEVLNDINNGLGTKSELVLYLIRYKNDINNKYIKRVILNKDDELKLDYGYEVYCNYNMTKLGEAYKDMKRSLDYFESKIKKDDYKIDNYDVNTVIRSIAAVNDKLKSFEKKANESLKHNVKESFDDVDNLDDGSCRGYGLLVRNMNTGYITLLCYNSKDLAEQNLTIGKLMEDETNYDYSMYDEDLDIIFSTAKFVVEEIDARNDINFYKEDGKKVYVYGDDEDYYEIINDGMWIDLYY